MINGRIYNQYKCLPFLAMMLLSLDVLGRIFCTKLVWTNTIYAGFLLSPFWFLINDVIAEIYDYKISLKLFWYMYICQNIFLGIIFISMAAGLTSSIESNFGIIFDNLWNQFIFNPLALLIAWYINVRLLTKWKILLKGKYFWLRSIGSSGIAEVLYPALLLSKAFIYHDFKKLFLFFVSLSIIRLLSTSLLAFPGSLAVKLIRLIESRDTNNQQINFNPFKDEKNLLR